MSRWKEPEPQICDCGHEDPHPDWTKVTDLDPRGRIALYCRICSALEHQKHPIPCVGCGGYDPRPSWQGEFNSPTGYWGGGFYQGQWFPWCPDCLEPLPVVCMHCMGADHDREHVCGEPLQLAGDAAARLWFRFHYECLQYPSFGIHLQHLLGKRDWGGESEFQDLPDAPTLWPSLEAAVEAIKPFFLNWLEHLNDPPPAPVKLKRPRRTQEVLDYKTVAYVGDTDFELDSMLAAGQAADIATTLFSSAHGGIEANGFVAILLGAGWPGVVLWLGGKAVPVVLAYALLFFGWPRFAAPLRVGVHLAAVGLFVVAGHNLAVGGL